MSNFNSMTLMAAGEMIAEMSTQAAFSSLVLGWGVEEFCGSGSGASKANDLVRFAQKQYGTAFCSDGKWEQRPKQSHD